MPEAAGYLGLRHRAYSNHWIILSGSYLHAASPGASVRCLAGRPAPSSCERHAPPGSPRAPGAAAGEPATWRVGGPVTGAPRISVVIPAYNASGTVKGSIESVLDQTIRARRGDRRRRRVDRRDRPGRERDRRRPDSADLPGERGRIGRPQCRHRSGQQPLGRVPGCRRPLAAAQARDTARRRSIARSGDGRQSGVYYVDDQLRVLSVERCHRSRDGLLECPPLPEHACRALDADRRSRPARGGLAVSTSRW